MNTTKEENLQIQLPFTDNPYYQDNPTLFLKLVNLLQHSRYGYSMKLIAKGRKRTPDIIPEYNDVYMWLCQKTSMLDSDYHLISTRCHWIVHGLTTFPKCKICGNPLIRFNVSPFFSYPPTCSKKCSHVFCS